MQVILGLTETFFITMGSLWTWLSTDIDFGIIIASPIDIMFSWVSLSVILVAIVIKKVVPLV
jgi:hypothetical protein